MPGTEMRALSTSSADLTSPTEEKKPACKACCACPQTKQARDLCIMENGEAQCQGLIEAHKESVPRILSHDELLQLVKHDSRPIPDFKRLQLEKMVDKNWDKFYRRNANRFFKPRHWTSREFEELGGICSKTLLFEVGCGVGDLVFPLVKENPSLFVYACDFSPLAIDLLKNNPEYSKGQVDAFVADASEAVFEQHIPAPVDMATLIFVLSAINPSKWRRTLKNIRKVIKPSGLLLFRDYGLYDHAMIRFGPGQKLGESFYFRHDGTYTYFFATEEIRRIFTEAGFVVVSCDYVFRETTNKKEDLCVPRIFIQAKFRVPAVRADAMSSPTAQT